MLVRSFPREDERNFHLHLFKAGPKEVVLMGTKSSTNFLIHPGPYWYYDNTVGALKKRVTALTARSGGGGPNVCVVQLDKKKFSQNFRRNVLNYLGAC